MKDFIVQNWTSIIIIFAIAFVIGLLVIQKKWDTLRGIAYKFMLAAEMAFSSGEGKQKFEAVFATVYNLIPAWFKVFVPENLLRQKLQEWFDLAKDWADDGTVNGSIGGAGK